MRLVPAVLAAALLAPALACAADEGPVVVLTLKGHRFSPAEVAVPAGRRIRVQLINRDAASEEFDSDDLGVEHDVTPNGRAAFTVGPLKPGTYSFMGEFHADTATGRFTAVEGPASAGR